MKEYKRETGQEELQKLLNDEVNQILRANLYEVGLSEKELKRLRIRKRELRDALNQCGIGDLAGYQCACKDCKVDESDKCKEPVSCQYGSIPEGEHIWTGIYKSGKSRKPLDADKRSRGL